MAGRSAEFQCCLWAETTGHLPISADKRWRAARRNHYQRRGRIQFKSEWEAEPVARYFYEKGFATFIMDYRVFPYTQMDSMLDSLRSVRYVRYHAKELNILPNKIAVLGGSAGAMQSAKAATAFDAGDPNAEDPVERVSSRPDACILSYGIWAQEDVLQRIGEPFDWEKQRLIEEDPYSIYSAKRHLNSKCPPFFVWQTNADDPRPGCSFCIAPYEYGHTVRVSHLPEGAHGGGLYDGKHRYAPYARSTSRWPQMASEFLENMGFLGKQGL